jgi:YfiH family protein
MSDPSGMDTLERSLPPLVQFASLACFPGLVHGVSTRHGGVSRGPFASLNLGWTVGDQRDRVETNYRLLCAALGVPRDHLATTWQVHGQHIVPAAAGDRGAMIAKADGIMTDVPNLPITQRYADCTPVLIYDRRRHVMGMAHAGWRGTVAGVSSVLVQAMASAYGVQVADLVAVVGPAIGPCCYEVGPEVVAAVRQAFPEAGDLLIRQPISAGNGQGGPARYHLDLPEANRWQLARAGVGQIEVSGICTRCRRDMYFSHRGDGGHTGRFAAVMMLES